LRRAEGSSDEVPGGAGGEEDEEKKDGEKLQGASVRLLY
jgi:hypothetical protein